MRTLGCCRSPGPYHYVDKLWVNIGLVSGLYSLPLKYNFTKHLAPRLPLRERFPSFLRLPTLLASSCSARGAPSSEQPRFIKDDSKSRDAACRTQICGSSLIGLHGTNADHALCFGLIRYYQGSEFWKVDDGQPTILDLGMGKRRSISTIRLRYFHFNLYT